ncbi:hypothetical protein HU200_009613 [Digitaria exilis]|uniref:Uncharacterized protein n=1 Tax=Digitaria exilis TaxID=1010633 RepID=A0A835FKG6_9POAL|nr:hypothetical protein HU200_063595 [Digitaria exilis]KAF8762303.1 hypothetical protein HU200_009613 [Digitaria exilis]
MEVFKIAQRPMALVGSPTDMLLEETFNTAKDCMVIVEFLLVKAPVHQDIVKELIPAGHSFLIVESQAKEGYLKAETVVNAIHALKVVANTFFRDAKFPEYYVPVVPLSSDDIDRLFLQGAHWLVHCVLHRFILGGSEEVPVRHRRGKLRKDQKVALSRL